MGRPTHQVDQRMIRKWCKSVYSSGYYRAFKVVQLIKYDTYLVPIRKALARCGYQVPSLFTLTVGTPCGIEQP